MTIKIYITSRLYFYNTFFMNFFDKLNIKYEFVNNYDTDVDLVILWINKIFSRIPQFFNKFLNNVTIMNNIENNNFLMDKNILNNYNFSPYSFIIKFDDLKYDKQLMNKYINQYKYNKYFGKDYWILKHTNSSKGIGTILIKTDELYNLDTNSRFIDELSNFGDKKHMTYIIQKYLEKPSVIDNRKYDIRAHFVLFSKLDNNNNIIYKFYLYNRLAGRITKVKFDLNNPDKQIHLTNAYVQSNDNFYNLKFFIDDNTYNKIFNNIFIQLKELISSNNFSNLIKKINKYPYFYNVFGTDFILDQDFNTYIVDLNCMPGMVLAIYQSENEYKSFSEVHLMECIYYKLIRRYNKYKKFINNDNLDKFNKYKEEYSFKNNFKSIYNI